MCLTIPKKVISIKNNGIIVENLNGKKQKAGSIMKVNVGDNVLTQNNIIIQKISKKQAKELANLFNK
jgi:hydrogenase maturation factor